jgi:hypothetical protein
MDNRADDRWRTPALEQFIRDLGSVARLEGAAIRRRRRHRAGGVVSIVLALSVAIVLLVGNGPRAASASAGVDKAAIAAEKAGTLRFRSEISLNISSRNPEVRLQTGGIDFRTGSYRLVVSGETDTPGLERIVTPGAVYSRQIAGRHGGWGRARLSPGPLLELGGGVADPLQLLRVLSTSRDAVRVGSSSVEGVAGTHYRLSSTLGAFLPSPIPAKELQAAQKVSAQVDVWLDRESRVRRAECVFSVTGQHPGRLQVATTFSGYGAPVSIQPPSGVKLISRQRLTGPASQPLNLQVLALLNSRATLRPGTPVIHRQRP